ncbi:hypothetical protein ANN_22834 [Periplaneta americana]|uniref:MADF domain-containing protein n=1 Tax=Periplaneta americana TaxID=6978 RepID=A0ABQ8SKM5_PERAM|nr:hypothetical protein ANN_22834 [Periplaneta americana]
MIWVAFCCATTANPFMELLVQEDPHSYTKMRRCSILLSCQLHIVLFDEILMLSVEENPHLYDKRRASYKDKKMKENTWFSIAASLNTDQVSSENVVARTERNKNDMISMADEDGDFLNKIIAGDELGATFNCLKTGLYLTSDTKKAPFMRQLGQEIMG